MIDGTVKQLCGKMNGIADAALIFSDINILYYTGFALTDSCLAVTADSAILFTDSRYTEAAGKKIGDENVINWTGRGVEALLDFFSSHNVKTVAVESDMMTLDELSDLRKKLPDVIFVTDDSLKNATHDLRIIKDRSQLDKMIAAQRIAEEAFDYILGFIKPGMTEKEVQLALDYRMLSHGASALSFETICVAGAKSSLPHGVPGDNIIKNGDFLTMDFGATVDGWHSDMTRTVAVGSADDEMKKVYSVVLEAQLAGLEIFAPGVACSAADKAARDVIEKAGYGEYFGHSLGHGVGVEIHEAPSVGPRSENILEVGHVVTCEPGIYIPGRFGVRIEDMAFITEGGCENLTRCPKELIIL